MNRPRPMGAVERRAMADAIRHMSKGGARISDLRRLPVSDKAIRNAVYGLRP